MITLEFLRNRMPGLLSNSRIEIVNVYYRSSTVLKED
jgi:hypothetical protein